MMLGIFVIFAIFVILFGICYLPVLYHYYKAKLARREFEKSLAKLPTFFANYVIIITDKLGEGTEPKSKITFNQVHKNQEFAVNSTLELLKTL